MWWRRSADLALPRSWVWRGAAGPADARQGSRSRAPGRVIPAFCSRQIAAVNGAVFLLNNFGTIERDVPLILSAHRVRSLGAACHETACFGPVILPRNGRSITWRICENHTRGQPNSIRLQPGQSGPQCWLGRSCFYPGIFIFELCAGNACHAGTRLPRLSLQRVAFLSRCVAF
jgi:hypothetical protein